LLLWQIRRGAMIFNSLTPPSLVTQALRTMSDQPTAPPTGLSRPRPLQSTEVVAATAPISRLDLENQSDSLPSPFDGLKPLGSRVRPIVPDEYGARIARAQQLLAEQSPKLDALFVAPGTSLYYFTGVRWWPSERLLGVLIPRKGQPLVVCPAFEEGRFPEQLRFPAEVRVCQAADTPTNLDATPHSERGIRPGLPPGEATRVCTC